MAGKIHGTYANAVHASDALVSPGANARGDVQIQHPTGVRIPPAMAVKRRASIPYVGKCLAYSFWHP